MSKNKNKGVIEGEEMLEDFLSDLDRGESAKGGEEPSPVDGSRQPEEPSEPSHENGGNEFGDDGYGATTEPSPKTTSTDTDWEKRFKDTQKSFNDERQKRLALEQQMQEYRESKANGETTSNQDKEVSDIIASLSEEFEEDPDKAFARAVSMMQEQNRRVAQQMQEIQQQSQNERTESVARQEQAAKARHSDYEDFVSDAFISELESSSDLVAKWQGLATELGGDKAEAAYIVAKRHRAYKEYLETGIMPSYANDSGKQGSQAKGKEIRTLDDVSSSPPPPRRKNYGVKQFASLDEVDEALFSHL